MRGPLFIHQDCPKRYALSIALSPTQQKGGDELELARLLALVFLRLGLVEPSLARRNLLPLVGELPTPLALELVRRVSLVDPLTFEVVPLEAFVALDKTLPGTAKTHPLFRFGKRDGRLLIGLDAVLKQKKGGRKGPMLWGC